MTRLMSPRVLAALLVAIPGVARAATGAPPPAAPGARDELVEAEPPPFSPGIFPCSQCHEGTPNTERRELAFHDEIQARFRHDSEHRWCLDCHDAQNRDQLHLANGSPVKFTESYRLCGQCHGDKYRDWRVGVHGKRIGHWDGKKTYFLCVSCHDPHAPRFEALKPEPRPLRPEEMRR